MAMPLLLTAENWKRTGRWDIMEGELYKLQDRKRQWYCLAPTHEEEITSLVASLHVNASQLPIKLYQIGRKYRDEMRPRGGLLRGKEFIMKDLYTFDKDEASALETYEEVREAYHRIFTRLGVNFAVAEADTGAIGGTRSHEYQLVSNVGEDTLLTCESCGYAANVERARGKWNGTNAVGESHENALTRWAKTTQSSRKEFQAHGYKDGDELVIVLHHPAVKLNAVKVNEAIPNAHSVSADEALQMTTGPHRFIIDSSVDASVDSESQDLRETIAGEGCTNCANGVLETASAIECGHTFYLGTKYSQTLNATFNNKGEKEQFVMGCFGIGVSRLVGAIAEARQDKEGIAWPSSVAPFSACVVPVVPRNGKKQDAIMQAANKVVDVLARKYGLDEVILDDRIGMDLKTRIEEAKLVGYPRLVVLGKSLEAGNVELHDRQSNKAEMISLDLLDDRL